MGPTTAAPTAPTTAAPVAPTTVAPTVAPSTPAPPTSGGGQGACMRNTDCAVNPWCADTNYDSWCPSQPACPSPHCTRASDTSASPEPEPEPEPEQPEVPASGSVT